MAIRLSAHTRLDEIDEAVVLDFVDQDADEDVYLEFKEGWDSQDPQHKYRIRRALGSLANTLGGFLIFGVLDKGNKQSRRGRDRIVGIADTVEAGRRITQSYLQPGLCIPALVFEGPRIIQVNGKEVAVVKVPVGDDKPYGIRQAQDKPLEFWTRSAGTARPMEYSHLLAEVDRSRETRGWLIALHMETQSIEIIARKNIEVVRGLEKMPRRFNSILVSDAGTILRVLGNDPIISSRTLGLRVLVAGADENRTFLETLGFSTRADKDRRMSDLLQMLQRDYTWIAQRAAELSQYLFTTYAAIREFVVSANSLAASLSADAQTSGSETDGPIRPEEKGADSLSSPQAQK